MGCGCNKTQAIQNTPVLKMVSEETVTKENEIEILQKFEDGSEKRFVIKRRNIGVERNFKA